MQRIIKKQCLQHDTISLTQMKPQHTSTLALSPWPTSYKNRLIWKKNNFLFVSYYCSMYLKVPFTLAEIAYLREVYVRVTRCEVRPGALPKLHLISKISSSGEIVYFGEGLNGILSH